MSDLRFMLSPKFINTVLNNNFGIADETYTDTSIYVGLGIDFDEESFSFSKEPVKKWFTINETPIQFGEPINGVIRNELAIEWDKAKVDWTKNSDMIKWIGLYYKYQTDDLDKEPKYELIAVLPLIPAETVKTGERIVLNPNSIQLKLSNR